ncbi:putative efflux protein [Lojkania enalia]|uniref:Efflux protein n=1 Tax=Lojkania enalia TaxID=147567 RepID=A0A9P4MX38_9PLEO|nr:putative efflux protein [Didymosphaeria enalia]
MSSSCTLLDVVNVKRYTDYCSSRRTSRLGDAEHTKSLKGVKDPDFLALGLGGTNLMAMLWAVAMGRRTVGVEMRGEPFLGVHWNIREDLYHQLGLIDQLMLERYGEEGIPRRDDGAILSLADCFYSSKTTGSNIRPEEIIDGYDTDHHIVGTIHHVEFIDDRYKNGRPQRVITELPPPLPPLFPDPSKIRSNMEDVLDGPSTFQASAFSIQAPLRRYLEKIERMDFAADRMPRVRVFANHRAVQEGSDGLIRQSDGRVQVRIEEIMEMDYKGTLKRIRMPGSDIIDIGVPKLFSIAEGAHSYDAERLGFAQYDVKVDHRDCQGSRVAQADYVAALMELLVDGRLRRRIASHFGPDGSESWLRQIAVGHEDDTEVAWVLVEVPDYMTFCPVEAGLVASDTCKETPQYFAAHQMLLYDFYMEQAALVLGMKEHELRKVEMVYGPKLFTLVERMGKDARVARNGVVAGDTFGNGHFMTSGGAMAGMIGHSSRFLSHFEAQNEGVDPETSIRNLADQIKKDTEAWLKVSATEFTQAIPINFGAERGLKIAAASEISKDARASAMGKGRRERKGLLPLDASDWRRLFLRNGIVYTKNLPSLSRFHPDVLKMQNEATAILEVRARL